MANVKIDRGSYVIKNESGSDFPIAEFAGEILAPGATRDLLDPNLTPHYDSFSTAKRVVEKCPGGSICPAVNAETLSVVGTPREPDSIQEQAAEAEAAGDTLVP